MKSQFKLRRLFLSFCFVSSASAAFANSMGSEQNIVGGTIVTDTLSFEYQHTVRLLVRAFTAGSELPENMRGIRLSWRCSASILGKRVLLSAAHCFPKTIGLKDPQSGQNYRAKLADLKAEAFFRLDSRVDQTSGIRSQKIIVHEGFRDDWTSQVADVWNPTESIHDIALVKLESDVPSDKSPVGLLTAQDQPLKEGENLVMTGYGRDLSDGQISIPRLRRVVVPLRETLRNRTEWYAGFGDTRNAGKVDNPAGGCQGDSGGPVFALRGSQARLVGVVVRGPDDVNGGCAASVTISTSLPPYASWIASHMND